MAFTLPADLKTNWVDDVQNTVIHASDWNNVSAMGNALKAAVGTWGFNVKTTTVATSESTSSTSYTDLTTTTDQVTVGIGSSGKALVMLSADITNNSYCGYMGYDVSGSTTAAASDAKAVMVWGTGGATVGKTVSTTFLEEGLTPGFCTFKLKYKTTNASYAATFANRRITVIPFPSTDGTHASATLPLDLSSSLSMGVTGTGVNRPVFDAAATQVSNSTTSLTWTHTATAGATVLVAFTRGFAGSGGSVTYDGNAMSYVGSVVQNNSPSDSGTTYLFAASNVAGGAKTVVASWTGAATGAACSVSYTGVAGLGQVTTGYGSSATPTLTVASTHNDGRLLVCAGSIRGGGSDTITGVSGGTQRALAQPSVKYYDTVIQDATGNSVNFGITPSATPAKWGGVSVELLPVVPSYSTPTWVGTGVGAQRQANPGCSWVDVVPADANLALVWVTEMPSSQANTCTVTLGGTSMTEVAGSPWEWAVGSGTYERIRCFYLQNPSTGPNKTVAITSNVSNYFHAHSVYYGGVSSVAPALALAKGPSGSPSTTITASEVGHLYPQCFSFRPADVTSAFSAYSGQLRASHDNSGGGYTVPMVVGDTAGTGADIATSATRNNGTYWGGVTLDLSPSALPTPTVPTWVGNGAGRQHFSGNYSWIETVPANATCAVVWLSVMGSTACSVTLGGTAMTALTGSPFTYYSGNYSLQPFFLLNPPTGGNKTLAVTNTNGNNVHAIVAFYGGTAGVFTPIAAVDSGAGQHASVSVSGTRTDHRYVSAMAYRPNATYDGFSALTNATRRGDVQCYSYDLPMIVGDAMGTGGTLAVTGTRTNTAYDSWSAVSLDLSPTAAAPATLSLAPSLVVGMTARSTEAVTFDSVGAGVVGVGGTTFSWSHTIGANAKALVVAANFYNNGLASPTFTNAKVGNTTLSVLGSPFRCWTSSGWPMYVVFLGVLNPPTGTQTVQFTTAATYTGCNSFAYNNVASFGSVSTDTSDGQVGTPATYTAPATNAENMVIQMFSGYTTQFSSYTGGTERWNPSRGTGMAYVVGDAIGTGSSMNFSAVHSANGYGAISLVLNAK